MMELEMGHEQKIYPASLQGNDENRGIIFMNTLDNAIKTRFGEHALQNASKFIRRPKSDKGI
jgi:hypothetical protein